MFHFYFQEVGMFSLFGFEVLQYSLLGSDVGVEAVKLTPAYRTVGLNATAIQDCRFSPNAYV